MNHQDVAKLKALYVKHVGFGEFDLAELHRVIKRDTLLAEQGKTPWVSRGLLREHRAERAYIGRMVKQSQA